MKYILCFRVSDVRGLVKEILVWFCFFLTILSGTHVSFIASAFCKSSQVAFLLVVEAPGPRSGDSLRMCSLHGSGTAQIFFAVYIFVLVCHLMLLGIQRTFILPGLLFFLSLHRHRAHYWGRCFLGCSDAVWLSKGGLFGYCRLPGCRSCPCGPVCSLDH